ncbi:hypothetical protein GGR53DRAFT_14394 [Hypoxylon sp. FL1150]|nr:hypothetical protein GGR53DRAFT_14394 [Hypoxylon sp. FL1150]
MDKMDIKLSRLSNPQRRSIRVHQVIISGQPSFPRKREGSAITVLIFISLHIYTPSYLHLHTRTTSSSKRDRPFHNIISTLSSSTFTWLIQQPAHTHIKLTEHYKASTVAPCISPDHLNNTTPSLTQGINIHTYHVDNMYMHTCGNCGTEYTTGSCWYCHPQNKPQQPAPTEAQRAHVHTHTHVHCH